MSIWTSDRPMRLRASALALILPLAGCMGEGTGNHGFAFLKAPGDSFSAAEPALTRAAFFGGRVIVQSPRGYCLDESSLREGGASAFVLIASCESLTGRTGVEVDPVVMTVSVLPRRLDAEQPTAAVLAASMAPARALVEEDGDGISLVKFASGGDAILPQGEPKHWRAGMMINKHIVSLASYTPKGSDLSGKTLLLDQAELLLENSPVRDYSPAVPETKVVPDQPQGGIAALLGGLFPDSD